MMFMFRGWQDFYHKIYVQSFLAYIMQTQPVVTYLKTLNKPQFSKMGEAG